MSENGGAFWSDLADDMTDPEYAQEHTAALLEVETPAVSGLELDPRWDWVEILTWGGQTVCWQKVACNHLEVEPVESIVTGEIVAQWCQTCSTQLPGKGEWA